jgi:flagellar basal-body rod protein FlgF
MNVSLYQAASALNATSRWQEVIAENLASASVPGFKKQELSFSALQSGPLPAPTGPAHAANRNFMLPQVGVTTSFLQGELRHTGVITDVAIEGPGFFEVQLPGGATGYTRDGEFKLDAQGQLVTKEGYLVLSDGGTVILDPNNPAPLTISPTGEVSQGADLKGRLRVAEFNDPQLLTQISRGYFLANHPNLQTNDAAASSVRQGYVEASNASATREMVSLMTALRSFEANQRVIQLHDERVSRAIAELGQTS